MSEEIEITETETDSKSLFDKTGEELTVGDALKLQAVGFAGTLVVSVAAGAIAYGGVVAYDKFATWNRRRRWEKAADPLVLVEEAVEVTSEEE